MTAITPLEFIHKKGIFGDHHKKNEVDLLRFSEIKNLSLIQVVQYKKSKVNIKDIKIENLEIVKTYFGFGNEKAKDALEVLSDTQIEEIKTQLTKGGVEKK